MTATRAVPWSGRPGARGQFRPELLYLGWGWAAPADPGLPPVPPLRVEPDQVSPDWLAAQRREHARLSRPARLTAVAAAAAAATASASWLSGWLPAGLALLAGCVALAGAALSCLRLWRGRRALTGQVRAEEQRVAAFQAAQRDDLAAQRQEYGRQLRGWQQQAAAFARRPHWHPVTLPVGVRRVDVAGGTLAGWSALLTTMAIARLASGGEVTVLDLTDGGVAADLITLARQQGVGPLVWALPADLPQLDLGADFGAELMADVLARTAAAASPASGEPPDTARDAALLRRVLGALGDGATLRQLTAALRAVGQIGGPPDHLRSAELAPDQLARLATLAGRGAEQFVIERAWTLEAALEVLSPLATGQVSQPASALRIAGLDGRVGPLAGSALAAYLVIAFTEVVRGSRSGAAWQHAVFVLGAERLPADVLDRLCDAAEITATGLVLAYRSIPPQIRDRLGRGDSAVAVMRLGNAADARLAAEQIGTEHRFVVSQLTDSVGMSVSDAVGGSYTSTVSTTDSVASSLSVTETAGRSYGRGHSRAGGFGPFASAGGTASRDESWSAALSDATSMSTGINAGTSWGAATSRTVGLTGSAARAAQRTREFLVEPHELQRLPHSAVVLCYPGPGGRTVALADANPAIMTLPTAALAARAAPDEHPPAGRGPRSPMGVRPG